MLRVRHCIECPKCLTRYVISRTPYDNGSYVIPAFEGSADEYILYCSCGNRSVGYRSRSSEVLLCYVWTAAYERGHGTVREIVPVDRRIRGQWSVDVGKYLTQWKAERKNSA